jgi:uncharacterized damage-inducible protein DinB
MGKKIEDLRDTLFETIELLKTNKIEVDKAKAIQSIAQTIVNSAQVEVDYLSQINATAGTGFIDAPKQLKKAV